MNIHPPPPPINILATALAIECLTYITSQFLLFQLLPERKWSIAANTGLNYVSCGSMVPNPRATQEVNNTTLSSLAVLSSTQGTETKRTPKGVPRSSTAIAYAAPPESISPVVSSLPYDNPNQHYLLYPNVMGARWTCSYQFSLHTR